MNQHLRKRLATKDLLFFIGIIFLLSFINPCLAQDKKTAETYKTLIKQGDKAFAAQDYKGAILLYEKAHQAKPDYNYATNKIEEITKILDSGSDSIAQSALRKKSISSYKTLIAQADYAFDAKEYADAWLLYEKAYQTRPDYNYTTERIDKITSLLNAAPDTKSQIFKTKIRKADSLYALKNYQLAKPEYQKALLLEPTAQLPKERLEHIKASFIDPDDMANFNLAIANGDKELALSDFDKALFFYDAALELHPNSKFVTKKISDIKKQQADHKAQTGQPAINTASANNPIQSEKPGQALAENQNKLVITTDNLNVKGDVKESDNTATSIKTRDKNSASIEHEESQMQKDQQKYDAILASAENLLKSTDYEAALKKFKSASAIKPAESYPLVKISEIEAKLASLKNMDENYASAITGGDRLLSELKYNEALSSYKQALAIKPNETYPVSKISGITLILEKQKSDSENYAQALRTGEKAQAAGDYTLALTSFQDARKIKPSEQYPQEQINAIMVLQANQQKKEQKYTTTINTGDQLFAGKDYNKALIAYSEASDLKKNEKYPQDQIAKIKIILADLQSSDANYNLSITEGDRFFAIKDYAEAKSAFVKAAGLKPAETYPRQRITAIDKIIEETAKARSSEYNNALEVADKLYNKKVFDQAIDAYEAAAKINPGDTYPEIQIGKIRKYMSDHAILDLNSQALIINTGNEKKFSFSAIDPSLRKNNYILLKARSTSKTAPKVYLNYGKDDTKNGGIVLRDMDKTTLRDFLISISIQDKWFREDNNWISIAVETGGIEITKVQIAAGE
jgi:tetratricopeptide (TPR) repeat protein